MAPAAHAALQALGERPFRRLAREPPLYFGVPIPLWYPLSGDGEPDYDHPILPVSLPTDPSTDTPPGYDEAQRGKPGGFTGEPDVLDTWATSTLTPSIAGFAPDRWICGQRGRRWLYVRLLNSSYCSAFYRLRTSAETVSLVMTLIGARVSTASDCRGVWL